MLEMLRLFFLITPIVIFVIGIIQIIRKDYFEDIEYYIETVMDFLIFIMIVHPILYYELLFLEEDI
jgi:hypothetical protein